MRQHWRETAEMVSEGDWRILGELPDGRLVVPIGNGTWRGLYQPTNPRHWRFWLRSRLTRRIAFIDG